MKLLASANAPVSDNPRASQLFAAAALVLGIGAGINSREPATCLTFLAAGLVGVAFTASARGTGGREGGFMIRILAVGIAANVLIGLVAPPLVENWYRPFLAVVGTAAIGALFVPRLRTTLLVAVVVGQFAVFAWMVATKEPSDIDVYFFQQEASEVLLSGENPYELRYRNIYGEGTDLYAPEVQSGDRVDFGFPYPPLSLLMALPGYLAATEYRYGAAVAAGVTALFLAFMRPSAAGAGIPAIFILSPLTLRVIYNGWTESFVGVLLAGAVLTAIRAPRWTPVLLGLLIASKQYMLPVLVPAVALLEAARRRTGAKRMIGIPIAVAAATVLPFLLWNPAEFIHSVVLLQAYQPFRPDSVSIPGLLARLDLIVLPAWIAFLGGGAALLAVSRWAPRTPAGFAGATAIFFFVFFLLSKQAFMNYYYLVLVAVSCAVAATASARGPAGTSR